MLGRIIKLSLLFVVWFQYSFAFNQGYEKVLVQSIRNESFEVALKRIDSVINVADESSQKKIIANCWYFKNMLCLTHNKYLLAMNCIIKANNIYETINDSLGIANCNLQIGVILNITKDFSKSNIYLEKAENIYTAQNDSLKIAVSTLFVGHQQH